MAASKPIWAARLDAVSALDGEYPNMAFEEWYQHGLECYAWNMPRTLARNAFRALVTKWHRRGKSVATWQIRAFVYGLRGGCDVTKVRRAPDFEWPLPSDPAWQLIAFVYLDGHTELDWLHPVSRRFWSEENTAFDLPRHEPGEMCGGDWFRGMGFDVLSEWLPTATVSVAPPDRIPHLRPVR